MQTEDKPSVALKMYRDIDGGDITRYGCLYFSDKKFCNNAQFLTIPTDVFYEYAESGALRYPMLGSQWLSWYTPEEICAMVEDKYVIVGDFEHDLHSTYVGRVPGPMLSFLAYRELATGRHIYPWEEFLILTVIYAIMVSVMLRGVSLWKKLPANKNSFVRCILTIIRIVWSFVEWGGILILINLAMYWAFADSYSQPAAWLLFTIITIKNKIVEHKKMVKTNLK